MDGHSCRRTASSLEKYPLCAASRDISTVLQPCTGLPRGASGWMILQPMLLVEMPFQREPAWHYSQRCTVACSQDLLAVIEEKCTKNSLCSPKSYICEVCCGTCTIISFPEAPHCPVSLLNSPFQSGHLNDEEVL